MALTTNLRTRLAALLAGTYTTGGRYVTGVTFTESPVFLPQENPKWPDVVVDRTWDLHWSPPGQPLRWYTASRQVNVYESPHITELGAVLRVQYEIAHPEQLAQRSSELVLGEIEAASRKATDDAAALRYILHYTPNWNGDGTAIDCWVGEIATQKADELRLVTTIPLTWLVSMSGVEPPGFGS